IVNINTNVTTSEAEKIGDLQSHQPAATADVENGFVTAEIDYLAEKPEKLSSGSFKTAQRTDISPQPQRWGLRLTIDCTIQIIERFQCDQNCVPHSFQGAERRAGPRVNVDFQSADV